MSLKLYFHPLASFCWKALIPLYENDTPFEPVIVDLGNADSRARLRGRLAARQIPRASRRSARIAPSPRRRPSSNISTAFYPGPDARSSPRTPTRAWQARMWDRVFDHYVHEPMQKIVGDNLRPEGGDDAVRRRAGEGPDPRRPTRFSTGRSDRGTWAMGERILARRLRRVSRRSSTPNRRSLRSGASKPRRPISTG